MGTAEEKDDVVIDVREPEVPADEPASLDEVIEVKEGETPTGENQEPETDSDQVDVILEGTPPLTQQRVDTIIQKRVGKLNNRLTEAAETISTSNQELEAEREKVRVMQLALNQQQGQDTKPVGIPNPDDFDGGIYDPGFVKKQMEYTEDKITREVSRQVAQASETVIKDSTQNQKARNLRQKQTAHYERAGKLGTRDYEAKEDIAIGILGVDRTNQLIENFDDAHVLLYYFGTDTDAAENFNALMEKDVVQGIAEIGRLQSRLKIVPKANTAPNPDLELEGGNSPGVDTDKKLDRLFDEAVKTGSMKKVLAYQRTLRDAAQK